MDKSTDKTEARLLLISPQDYTKGWNISAKELPLNNVDAWIGRCWPEIPNLRLCWHSQARLVILDHCYQTPDMEVGGVLLGGVYREPGGADEYPRYFIEITASIEARSLDSGQGHINFSPRSWAEINRIRDRDYPNERIVGWYHTHPGHSVFLSGHDLPIQNNFFNQDFHLALVVETHQHYGAFFVGSDRQGGPYRSEDFRWDHELFENLMRPEPVRSVAHSDNRVRDTVPTRPALSGERDSAPVSISIEAADLEDDRGPVMYEDHPPRGERRTHDRPVAWPTSKQILYLLGIGIFLVLVLGIVIWLLLPGTQEQSAPFSTPMPTFTITPTPMPSHTSTPVSSPTVSTGVQQDSGGFLEVIFILVLVAAVVGVVVVLLILLYEPKFLLYIYTFFESVVTSFKGNSN